MIYINPIVQDLAQRKQQQKPQKTKQKQSSVSFKQLLDEATRELERRENNARL